MRVLRPARADSIGLILHYECTYRCDHCLYACGPGLRENVRQEDLNRILDAVARATPRAWLHLGGGEPFLHPDRLVETLRGIRERRLSLEYVETNGFWIQRPGAREMLERVREAGCGRLLLSISPFHNAFLSCRDNRRAFRMIVEVFGPSGIFPWHPDHYGFLERVDPERPVPFREYAQRLDPRDLAVQLTGINYLHPAGRAAWRLAPWLESRPAEDFLGKNCRGELSSPVHAHVDPQGHYLTGFCSGLQIGDRQAFSLEALFREGVPLQDYPVLEMLVEGKLGDLFRHARQRGFREDPAGYVSCCHLCGHLRLWLYRHVPAAQRPMELAPALFYDRLAEASALREFLPNGRPEGGIRSY